MAHETDDFRRPKRRLAVAALCAGLLGAGAMGTMGPSFAQLSTDRTGANPGDLVRLDQRLSARRTDNLYLAAQLGGNLYFFGERGDVSPYTPGASTPRRAAGGSAGLQTLMEITVPEGLNMPVTFYTAYGPGGGDILATPGAIDMSTLSSLTVDLTAIAGGPSYAANCQSCHDYDPAANISNIQAGKDAGRIKAAIAANKGGMGYLSSLGVREIDAISYWLQSPRFDCH